MKSQQHLLLLLIFLTLGIVVSLLAHDWAAIVFRSTQIDSIGHLIGFFTLTWFLHGVFKFPLVNLAITLVCYGGLTEIAQWHLGFRNGEFSDFLADVAGVTLFVALKWLKVVYYDRRQYK